VKVLADMHVAPPLRRWMTRFGLALVVAIAIGYLPGQMFRRDPRAVKLQVELEQMRGDARQLAADNAVLYKEVEALRSDVNAVEERARADLGMVYPDEVVLRVRRTEAGQP
jgi:cell division protein FtsB